MTVRPIDGDALKKQIKHIPRTINPDLVQYSLVQAIIADMPTLTPPNEWISVEERLPDSQADVLVVAFWHENWQTMIGWHSDTGKKWRVITPHGEMEPGGVTHWMPLPAPPEKEE